MGLKIQKYLSLFFIAAVINFSATFSSAGLYSEIDIIVREAATLRFSSFVDPSAHYDLFSKIKIFESDEEVPGCDFVIQGIAPLPDRTFTFTACVVAPNKNQITATIIDFK